MPVVATESQRIRLAAQEYLDRKRGHSQPEGRFDHRGVWLPYESERRRCCRSFVSRDVDLYSHCFSLVHVATLYWVSPLKVRLFLTGLGREEEENSNG